MPYALFAVKKYVKSGVVLAICHYIGNPRNIHLSKYSCFIGKNRISLDKFYHIFEYILNIINFIVLPKIRLPELVYLQSDDTVLKESSYIQKKDL